MRIEVNINADMLTWAIARAGYELHEFTAKAPKVKDWIEGSKKPTVKQLESFSKKVHLPFGYLFLPEPPKEKLPIPFFRTNGNQTEKVSVNVYDIATAEYFIMETFIFLSSCTAGGWRIASESQMFNCKPISYSFANFFPNQIN